MRDTNRGYVTLYLFFLNLQHLFVQKCKLEYVLILILLENTSELTTTSKKTTSVKSNKARFSISENFYWNNKKHTIRIFAPYHAMQSN